MKILCVIVVLLFIGVSLGDKKSHKYTAEANSPMMNENYDPDFRNLQKPFRIAKLNLVWTKAQHVSPLHLTNILPTTFIPITLLQRLTEPKLKSLYTELKIHDKEELNWKQSQGQHKDKEGLKEAELRKKLIGIMSTYDLLHHFDDTQDPEIVKQHAPYEGRVKNYENKSLFKDKKLNRLWEKAEVAGFTPEEMNLLKDEFFHHQQKLDLYYTLLDGVTKPVQKNSQMNAVDEDEHDSFNEIRKEQEDDLGEHQVHNDIHMGAQLLREKHRDIKDSIDRLERITAKGPNSQEFVEPKVQGLYRIAVASNFTNEELQSLKIELLHYESRLLKLRRMNADHALAMQKMKTAKNLDKHDQISVMEADIKKQARKVEKIQEEMERRVLKHSEL